MTLFFQNYIFSQLWYPLAKTLSEQAAWALAVDRKLKMVSINAGLVLGPAVAEENSGSTISYLKGRRRKFFRKVFVQLWELLRNFEGQTGAAQMYENGVLAVVDVKFLVDVHIRAMEDSSTGGRYFCFDQIVNSEEETVKLANILRPLISLPQR